MLVRMTFHNAVEGWHDFYLTAGAASATLAGLLFVGLSLHIRVVVSHPDVRALARVTLTDFFVILLVALALLVPTTSSISIAVWLLATGIVSLIIMAKPTRQGFRRRAERALALRVLAGRIGASVLAFASIVAVGALFWSGDYNDGLNALVGIVIALLVIAVRNTWDLLVTVAVSSEPIA